MIELLLTDEERLLLVEMLDNGISELRMEISNTDRIDYKEMLKNRENLMKKLYAALQVEP